MIRQVGGCLAPAKPVLVSATGHPGWRGSRLLSQNKHCAPQLTTQTHPTALALARPRRHCPRHRHSSPARIVHISVETRSKPRESFVYIDFTFLRSGIRVLCCGCEASRAAKRVCLADRVRLPEVTLRTTHHLALPHLTSPHSTSLHLPS